VIEPRRTAAVVLAAGSASRFGAPKALADLNGRPLLQHVLDAAATLDLARVVVVLGEDADRIEAGLTWRSETRVRNPAPQDGLSSSLRIGMAELGTDVDAALILLGDQPLVRRDVIESLLAAAEPDTRPVAAPRYSGGGGPNPVLIHRRAWDLVSEAEADRGLGPVIGRHPGLVARVEVDGANPDVDTPADLDALEATRPRAGRPSDRAAQTR
jgi:molybdenum cofactor cytidylyltransferase